MPQPGDTITSQSRIVDVYEKSGRSGMLGFSVKETVFTNQNGEVLCIDRYTGVVREMS